MAAVLIKKYGNRRLYDTGDSKYVTLDELAAKIRSGVDLRVVDAQTSDDLTQATLVQIVLEGGNAAKFLPVQLLTQMIRLSDDSLAEFFSRYVTGALDLYLQAKRGVQSISAYNPLAQIPVAATDALTRMWMGSPFAPPYQQPYGYAQGAPFGDGFRPAPPPDLESDEDSPRSDRKSSPMMDRERGERGEGRGDRAERKSSPAIDRNERGGSGNERGDRSERAGTDRGSSERGSSERGSGERGSSERNGLDRGRERDDMATMRRELDELKQVIRDGLSKPPRKKRKP